MSVRNFSENDLDYEIVKFIGQSGLGRTYKVKRKSDGKIMVCSNINLVKAEGVDIIHSKVTALRTLEECRYVVLWDDLSLDPERFIVHLHMDVSFNPEITLESFIEASKSNIKKEIIAVIINTLAKALVDCHQKGVYHQDIRPRNILLAKKEANGFSFYVAYLTNFGVRAMWEVASPPEESARESYIAETQCYMAPETLESSDPTFSSGSDVFALGCTMYELCCRTKAFQNKDRISVPVMSATLKGVYGSSMSPMPDSLMQFEADKRPGIETFSATMQTYCESRLAKFKTRQAWVGAGVQLVGAAAAVQNPAFAGVIHKATQATVDKVMAPGQAPAPAPGPVQTPLQPSEPTTVLARGLPQTEPSPPVPILPQKQVNVQTYPQTSEQSTSIGLQEIIEALLEVRSRAKAQSQSRAQVHPQASELSPEDLALAQEILLILLEKSSLAQRQNQLGAQVYPRSSTLVPGWGQSLSQTLPQVPGPTQQQQMQTSMQNHPQISKAPPSHQKAPSAALQPQPQTYQAQASDQIPGAANAPTPAQQAAFQLALQRQQAQLQNFGAIAQAQHNATNQTMAAMYANNRQTMQNAHSAYQDQAAQQFAQFQQSQAVSNENRHLAAQAFGQAIQGNDVLVFPAGQQSPYFYGGT